MKFIDPLATLKFMGGAISIHISMAFFAFYSYYYSYGSLSDCSNLEPFIPGDDETEAYLKLSTFYDVKLMMIGHLTCIFLAIL